MNAREPMTGLQHYRRYSLKAHILDDPEMLSWFADLCAGESPKANVSEEMLALLEGDGLIRKTDFGWVLGAEGREFGRELGVVPGPSRLEIDPSVITKAGPQGEIDQSAVDSGIVCSEKAREADETDIAQIWEGFCETHEEHYRNILLEYYRNIVRYCAERMHRKLPDKVELDDLVSAGIFGLMDAIDAFDPTRGVKFETYCLPRIRGSILDELRSTGRVPRMVPDRTHQLDTANRRLETDISEIDIVRDGRSRNPIIEAQKRSLKNLLTKGLTRTERLIVVLYYYEENTMKEIGSTLDMPESRVSQMLSSIIAKLKSQVGEKGK